MLGIFGVAGEFETLGEVEPEVMSCSSTGVCVSVCELHLE